MYMTIKKVLTPLVAALGSSSARVFRALDFFASQPAGLPQVPRVNKKNQNSKIKHENIKNLPAAGTPGPMGG